MDEPMQGQTGYGAVQKFGEPGAQLPQALQQMLAMAEQRAKGSMMNRDQAGQSVASQQPGMTPEAKAALAAILSKQMQGGNQLGY